MECLTRAEADIMLLVDGSWSVGRANFRTVRSFISRIVEAFEIGPQRVQIGLAQYSGDPRTEWQLNAHRDKKSLLQAVANLPYKGGNTLTGLALNFIRQQNFKTQAGMRPRARKVGILITDGKSQDDVEAPSKKLKDEGVELFAVGIKNADEGELKMIATDPDDIHTYNVADFESLSTIVDDLTINLCNSVKGPDMSAANREDQKDFQQMMTGFRVQLAPKLDYSLQSAWEITAQWSFQDDESTSMLILLDNAKSFGNPSLDERGILAPLYQCCVIRVSTWNRLNYLKNGVLKSALKFAMAHDPISPVVSNPHLDTMDQQLLSVLATAACESLRQAFTGVPDQYCFSVISNFIPWCSNESACALFPHAGDLEAPSDLVISERTHRSFRVSWKPPSDSVDRYKVEYYPVSGGKRQEFSVNRLKTSTVLKDLEPEAEYVVNVYSMVENEYSEPLKGTGKTSK
ncbi:Collagen alpha-1(XII) chain [Heterocephalus glaber]|uniref:Collagen alpha-1(XII) chain n=1 Tax=Heterocephalus glaber TaxID=10181 RepID=G5ALT9_HETGA|nr:Collagen alpha-1(XII) chain [Heterocephalus glaber]